MEAAAKSIQAHPRISKPDPTQYEWSPVAHPSKESFQKLLAKVSSRGQAWLTQAYADNIMDSLAKVETAGWRAQSGWSEQRERGAFRHRGAGRVGGSRR